MPFSIDTHGKENERNTHTHRDGGNKAFPLVFLCFYDSLKLSYTSASTPLKTHTHTHLQIHKHNTSEDLYNAALTVFYLSISPLLWMFV